MLQKCLSYYRIFYANKLGSRAFSRWQNFPIIFGSQFTQIQQNGNAHCNILFQSQQRYQFFTKNVGNNDPNDLDARVLWLDTNKTKNVTLEMQKGKSGQKIFKIILNRSGLFRNVPNILVPQDAYPFVNALDQLIWEMATKNFEQKLQIPVSNDGYQTNRRIKLQTIELNGIRHKFQLELLLFINMERRMLEKEIQFGIIAFNETTKHRRILTLPLHVLPWLRKQMVEMLVRHDGTEALSIEAPAQIPQQFFHKIESTNSQTAGMLN